MECKTDYLKRLILLKSEKPRIVFRKTNMYIIGQYVESEAAQDKIIFGASYLTGYLVAKKILKDKLKEPIVDLGMQRVIKKTKIFAFIKGLIDGGIKIKCDKENFPEAERLSGKSTKEDISKIVQEVKSKIDKL